MGGGTLQVTDQVTEQVTPEVRLALVLQQGAMSRQALQAQLGLKDDEYFRKSWLLPAIQAQWVELTLPDKPTSSKQQYRLTAKGRSLFKA